MSVDRTNPFGYIVSTAAVWYWNKFLKKFTNDWRSRCSMTSANQQSNATASQYFPGKTLWRRWREKTDEEDQSVEYIYYNEICHFKGYNFILLLTTLSYIENGQRYHLGGDLEQSQSKVLCWHSRLEVAAVSLQPQHASQLCWLCSAP